MKNITIREARLEDQGQVGPFLMTCLGPVLNEARQAAETAGLPFTEPEEELMAADDFYFSSIDLMNCLYIAIESVNEKEIIVGIAAMNPYVSEFQYIAVSPSYQRQGIGRALAQGIFDEADRRGMNHLTLQIPEHGITKSTEAFFTALGFQVIRKTVHMGRALQ